MKPKHTAMALKVGDRVKFLNDIGGGVITKIIDKQTVGVLREDDFEVPVLKEELILIEDDPMGEGLQVEQQEPVKKQEEKITFTAADRPVDYEDDDSAGDDLNVYLAFVPTNPNLPANSDLELYLINDSRWCLLYLLLRNMNQAVIQDNAGKLEGDTKMRLQIIPRDKLNEIKQLRVQMLVTDPFEAFDAQTPVDKTLKINPARFYKLKSYKENDFFDEPAIILPVVEQSSFVDSVQELSPEELEVAVYQKEVRSKQLNKKKSFAENLDPSQQHNIIDLHLHNLIDDESGLSNKEKLDIQMEHFRKALEEAIKKKQAKITFIHGIGNGVLRIELRRELDRCYKQLKYQDASFKEYGYGATLVLLR